MVTFREFCRIVGEDKKADLIGGQVFCLPSESSAENQLLGFALTALSGYLEAESTAGEVFFGKFVFRLGELDAVEPDIAYVSPARLQFVREDYMDGCPDIAVEIVSRDSRSRDYGEKRELYEAAGVLEYWIVDPLQRRVEFLRLADGKYELVPLEDNRIFRSQVIPGLWINVEWLLAKPVPKAYHCLQEILQSAEKAP